MLIKSWVGVLVVRDWFIMTLFLFTPENETQKLLNLMMLSGGKYEKLIIANIAYDCQQYEFIYLII